MALVFDTFYLLQYLHMWSNGVIKRREAIDASHPSSASFSSAQESLIKVINLPSSLMPFTAGSLSVAAIQSINIL